MCRIYGFRSAVFSGVHRSLVAAENALARQSDFHPDGWGVAYYVVDRFPHVIRNDAKALDDSLFREVSAVVSTRTLLAHIRKATAGEVSPLNCHPFQYGNWVFAHNGDIEGFPEDPALRGSLLHEVEPALRRYILGTTDSEVCFYIFLTRLLRSSAGAALHDESFPLEPVVAALRDTVRVTLARAHPPGSNRPRSRLTFVVTNGKLMAGYRLGRVLHYSTYKTSCPDRDGCPAYSTSMCERPTAAGKVNHLILTSERIQEGPNVWTEMADGEIVAVDAEMRLFRFPPAEARAA